jgi:uncharacterized protein (TIGR02266 family)
MMQSMRERRRDKRIKASLRVSYRTRRDLVVHNIRNISTGGFFIRSHHSPRVGTKIQFRLYPTLEEDPLALTGEVAWLQPGGGFGVRFSGLTDSVRESLNELVDRCAVLAEATLFPSEIH